MSQTSHSRAFPGEESGSLAPAPAPIRARLLGAIDIRVGDRVLGPRDWPRRQSRTILLMLLGTPGHRLPREVVIDAIWPEQDVDQSLNALYKALHALRRTLEPRLTSGRASAYIDIRNDVIALTPHDGLWVDVSRFSWLLGEAERAVDPRQSLRAALDLYRGDFVADEPYVDWPMARRESLRAERSRAALALARLDLEHGDPLQSIGHLEALLVEDPAFEEAHRAIIRAMLAGGQRTSALQQVERCRLAVRREFGAPLDPETEALAAAARAIPHPLPEAITRISGGLVRNLPGSPSPIIGRDEDIERVLERLGEPGIRLMTITGPGGVGKTRFAVEVARRGASRFPDGATFVDLAAIHSEQLLYQAIATSMEVWESPDRDLATTIHGVLSRRPGYLLVLDNLEHLPGLARTVASLLEAVPRLTILATSRQPLRIRAEHVYLLDTLPVPDLAAGEANVARVDSVRLFLQCARSWGGFDEESLQTSLPVIARICERLEGLPLAIELAAAQCWGSTFEDVLTRLEGSFDVLRDGPRDLPERHQALRATIQWSYDLLTSREQEVFRGISVFAGGAEIDVLEAMFGDDARVSVEALVEKNLVRWDHRLARRRLVMLETVREFAGEELRARGEVDEREQAHARFYATYFQRHFPAPDASSQLEWGQRMVRDHDNLHLALATSLARGDADLSIRLASGLGSYWFIHGCTADAVRWLREALGLEPVEPTEERAWAALWGAALAWRAANPVVARWFERYALDAWTVLGSLNGLTQVNHAVATRKGLEGHIEEAIDLHRANLDVFRGLGNVEGIVFSLVGIAHGLGRLGDSRAVFDLLEEALAAGQASGSFMLQSYVLARLPTACIAVGLPDRAMETASEGERIARLIGDHRSLPWASLVHASLADERNAPGVAYEHALVALAGFQDTGDILNEWIGYLTCLRATTALGRLDEARAHARECIRGVRAIGGDGELAAVLCEVGNLLLAFGCPEESLVTFASGATHGRQIDTLAPGFHPDRYQARIDLARNGLPPSVAKSAWEHGACLDPGVAMDLAFRWLGD